MARKRETGLDDIFRKTEAAAGVDAPDLSEGNIQSTGVGLREGEIAALEAIGKELGDRMGTEPVARNSLIRIATRLLIRSYRAGELDLVNFFELPEKPKARLRFRGEE